MYYEYEAIDSFSLQLHSAAQPQSIVGVCQTNRVTFVREILGNNIAQAWIPNAIARCLD